MQASLLQIAKANGTRAIVLSGSAGKLERVRALGADDGLDRTGDGRVASGVYRFREAAGIDVALASPETQRHLADVRNFTDATVVMRSLFSPM